MKNFISIPVILCFVQWGISQSKQVFPKDESNQNPSLAVFVSDLKKAIETKDEKWIYSVLDTKVISTYGDEEGVPTFIMYWSPENDSTDFWPYLTRVVEMGGVFLHDTADHTERYQFVFPYTYVVDLDIEDDYFNLGVITGKNVNLRSEPNTKSNVMKQLTYDVIRYNTEYDSGMLITSGINEFGNPDWYRIETYDQKQSGWVHWKYVYSLMGPRLFLFQNGQGQWKISAFVEGD